MKLCQENSHIEIVQFQGKHKSKILRFSKPPHFNIIRSTWYALTIYIENIEKRS